MSYGGYGPPSQPPRGHPPYGPDGHSYQGQQQYPPQYPAGFPGKKPNYKSLWKLVAVIVVVAIILIMIPVVAWLTKGPPKISEMGVDPSDPEAGDEITFSALLENADNMRFSSSIQFTRFSGGGSGGSEYTGSIPGNPYRFTDYDSYSSPGTITWELEIIDTEGNVKDSKTMEITVY